MARARPSVAGSVVAQAKARAAATPDVTSLDREKPALTRLDAGVNHHTARPFLRAVFPGVEKPYICDVSFLLEFPNLTEPISAAYLNRCINLRPRSRTGLSSTLRSGFFAFLRQERLQNLALADLTKPVFIAFVKWLAAPRLNGQPLSPGTRALALTAIGSTLEALEDLSKWKSEARKARQHIPINPWPGRSRRGEPRERLTRDELSAIVAAAEKEVGNIQRRMAECRQLLETGRAVLAAGGLDYSDLATCLAGLDHRYPGVIPDISVIDDADKDLGRAVRDIHRHGYLTSYFYASSRDLVPFVLLLGVATAFNPDALLELDWSGVTNVERLGSSAVRIAARKARAAVDPVVLLDATDSSRMGPGVLLAMLRDLTIRVRDSVIDSRHRDRIFVFVPRMAASKHPKAFDSTKCGPSNDHTWKWALQDFASAHGIKPFGLSQLRPTVLDEVQFLTGDLLAAKAVGQQRNPQTLWYHYTSSGTRNRYRERIGEILLLRERWRQTVGVIDPRARAVAQDKGAATPGFFCFDPFASPRPGQTPNRLCEAYGECPSCPLAAANIGDSAAVALYLALRTAIYHAQGRVTPKAWLERWAPVLSDLDGLLCQVPERVTAEAQRYRINLPPVG